VDNDYSALQERLRTLPDKLSYNVMVGLPASFTDCAVSKHPSFETGGALLCAYRFTGGPADRLQSGVTDAAREPCFLIPYYSSCGDTWCLLFFFPYM
jgi:hypothetical protein